VCKNSVKFTGNVICIPSRDVDGVEILRLEALDAHTILQELHVSLCMQRHAEGGPY
jgi:hypothetical protein